MIFVAHFVILFSCIFLQVFCPCALWCLCALKSFTFRLFFVHMVLAVLFLVMWPFLVSVFSFFLLFFSCCNVDIFTCFTVVLLLVLLCCDCCGCLRGFFRAVTFASLSYHQVSHLRHSHLPKFHSVHLYVCCELTCSCVDFHLSCVSLAMSIRSHS